MKQGLIFDLDGTLVDSLPGIEASLNHALGGLGFPRHVTADIRRFIGNGSRMLAKRAAPANADEETITAIEQAFKVHYDENWIHGTTPYPGIVELLEFLHERGHPLAVLSNKPHRFVMDIIGEIFAGRYFDRCLGQQDGSPHKPDPSGLLEICHALGRPPGDCLLIGDSTIDLETARNAQTRSMAVTWGYHDREPLAAAKPDFLVGSPEEIRRLFA